MPLGQLFTTRSWTDLRDELSNELRKWGIDRSDVILPAARESADRGYVELQFHFKGEWRTVKCNRFTGEVNGTNRNLAAIKESVKATRMADQRGIGATLAQVAELIALPDPNDPYRVLGLARTANKDAIKAAYRRAVQEAHPDKPGGSREKFDRVRRAAAALGII